VQSSIKEIKHLCPEVERVEKDPKYQYKHMEKDLDFYCK
jgi:hypothetical protein